MFYYNENDKFSAKWLENLIEKKLIPNGFVDTRSIVDVKAEDLIGYDQCHFFAGIGGWAYAVVLAGVDKIKGLWTGSCPCQPFSVAGKREGKSDNRHLWPEWYRLINECKPTIIFGEQVKAAASYGWIDDVYQGMEKSGYSCGLQVCQLVPLAHHIGVNGCGLWATPNTMDCLPPKEGIAIARQFTGSRKGRTCPSNLREQVNYKSYPMALWSTPSSRDWKDTPGMKKKSINKDGSTRNRSDQLGRQAFGLTAQTKSKGLLNPAFTCWLMGYPIEWESCADTVTR